MVKQKWVKQVQASERSLQTSLEETVAAYQRMRWGHHPFQESWALKEVVVMVAAVWSLAVS